MEYVEILRAKRVLFWYTLALLAILVITVVSMFSGHADLHAGSGMMSFSEVVLGCAMGALIAATCVAPGLIAEASSIGITWTRPTPRAQIAWRFIAVDVAAIAVAYLILIAVVLTFFALFGALGHVRFDASVGTTFFLGLGSAVMLYAIVTLVSSRLPGRGGLVAGMSWVVFIVLGTLWAAPLPAPLHALLTGLNYLNPISYFGGISGSDGSHHSVHPITLDQTSRLVVVWVLGIAALVGTVRLWSTREV